MHNRLLTGSNKLSDNKAVTITHHQIDNATQKISFSFLLKKKDYLYKDFIQFCVSDPRVILSNWHSTNPAVHYYDPAFKTTKDIFTNKVVISLTATMPEDIHEPAFVYFTYYQRSHKRLHQIECPLIMTDRTLDSTENILSIPYQTPVTPQIIISHKKQDHATTVITYWNESTGIHIFLITLLFILCIIPPYFFTKKIAVSIQINELLQLITATSCFLLIGYALHSMHHFSSLYINTVVTSVALLAMGIFYIKKSTHAQWSYIRTLCNLFGITAIAITILLFFKIAQLS